MNKKVAFEDLGLIDYKKCWDYQESLFLQTIEIKKKNRAQNTSFLTQNTLIFCEHPHVYTLGKSGDKNNLLVTDDYLKSRGASFYKINSFFCNIT